MLHTGKACLLGFLHRVGDPPSSPMNRGSDSSSPVLPPFLLHVWMQNNDLWSRAEIRNPPARSPVVARKMLASLLMAALGLAARVLAQEAACYAPNGDLANNETYVPCNKLGINQSGVFSSCCALDGPPDQRDTCSSSGLCINRQGQPQRGYCTDRTWKSKACNHVCTDVQVRGVLSAPQPPTR